MPRIEHIVAENYRGASTLLRIDFAKDKPVALIFGENGTGKTTVVDALDAVGNCSSGSLATKSSTRVRRHVPTIGKKPADVRVELAAGGTVWKVTINGDEITAAPQPRPKIRVLRRADLQRLIDSAPAVRYEALKHLLDVNKVQQSEDALRDASASAKKQFDEATRARADLEDQLDTVWEAEGRPNGAARAWASALAQEDGERLGNDVNRLATLVATIDEASGALTALQTATDDHTAQQAAVVEAERAATDLPGADAEQTMSLVGVLANAQQHLATGVHSDSCPVCRQPIDVGTLRADIDRRLDELHEYQEARNARKNATDALHAANRRVEEQRAGLIATARALLASAIGGGGSVLPLDGADYPALGAGLSADPVQEGEARRLLAVCAEQRPMLSAQHGELLRRSGQLAAISALSVRLETAVETTVELERIQGVLAEVYDLARRTRIEFTQNILDDVAGECNRLYAAIHPGEPIALSKLELDEGRRASLSQSARFEGYDDVPPQAYFSESHLDTLGFCFWLAAVERENPNGDAVVVLDDVFTSVDSGHLARIADMIADECEHFAHVIITTHQRLWRDIYRYARGDAAQTELIELQRWTLAKGISSFKSRLAMDEVGDALQALPFDRQVAASKAGILLEATLDALALQYRCHVPRTADNAYELKELLDGTTKLFKRLEAERPVVDASGKAVDPPQFSRMSATVVADALTSCGFVRNQVGAHFNIAGMAISDADVSDFAQLVVDLVEIVVCSGCGRIPSKRAGSYFMCGCVAPLNMRLHPLEI